MENKDRDAVNEDIINDINNSEKLLVLPLGEDSKKITQVITNDTAREIIELLAEHSMSASDIAKKLNVPLTTVKYNLENLVEVGLAKIERIKYSEKGRKVKVYAPVRKLIVVVPEKMDNGSIIDILKKYLGVILAAVLATGLVELLTGPYFKSDSMMKSEFEGMSSDEMVSNVSYYARDVAGAVNETANKMMINDTEGAVISEVAEEAVSMPTALPTHFVESIGMDTAQKAADTGLVFDNGLWFLFGCVFIIAAVIIVDYYRIRKKRY
ncbi:MAG TPA: winged helix-turn-helix domain-containing protein [archaeon]|nr:winged helix-turn-helix domain-containing protein [archaeon]